ncbi:MAG: hypothetical protein JRJ49_03715 [Deltaproteobacteria bacterium]|nr:hypothetical protein [Deltaproteobacteria bacterium]
MPANILKRASKAAINFHPSPPKYRGIGGYSWAIHNSDKIYGVTCHYMVEEIDCGAIIAVRSFSILDGETATSLKMRSGIYCLYLLNEILPMIIEGKELPLMQKTWGKKLYTYVDLDALTKQYGKKKT